MSYVFCFYTKKELFYKAANCTIQKYTQNYLSNISFKSCLPILKCRSNSQESCSF